MSRIPKFNTVDFIVKAIMLAIIVAGAWLFTWIANSPQDFPIVFMIYMIFYVHLITEHRRE